MSENKEWKKDRIWGSIGKNKEQRKSRKAEDEIK